MVRCWWRALQVPIQAGRNGPARAGWSSGDRCQIPRGVVKPTERHATPRSLDGNRRRASGQDGLRHGRIRVVLVCSLEGNMQLNLMTWKEILAFSVSVGARPTKRAEYDTNLTTLTFRALCAGPRC